MDQTHGRALGTDEHASSAGRRKKKGSLHFSSLNSPRLVIVGDRFTFRNPLPDADQNMEGVFRIVASKVPKELKLTLDGGQIFKEIYELEENILRVCYPIKGGERPMDFKTTPQSGLSLVVYEREIQP